MNTPLLHMYHEHCFSNERNPTKGLQISTKEFKLFYFKTFVFHVRFEVLFEPPPKSKSDFIHHHKLDVEQSVKTQRDKKA